MIITLRLSPCGHCLTFSFSPGKTSSQIPLPAVLNGPRDPPRQTQLGDSRSQWKMDFKRRTSQAPNPGRQISSGEESHLCPHKAPHVLSLVTH